ncbi:MAG: CopG family transcriptional regulator [Elusimicrobia bacterium HGW-Elusimicrobia-2]|nr:MAG: CopG family transcriptional regulator [Elusimicrobia bacterium HGW-Elusimicrobia-2]
MRTSVIQTLSLPPEMIEQATKIAKEEGMTKSELFREAFRQFMRRRRWEHIREYGAQKAAHLGIKDEQDIEKLVDEYRSGK